MGRTLLPQTDCRIFRQPHRGNGARLGRTVPSHAAQSGGPINPTTSGILDDVLAYTNRVVEVIDPYEVAATSLAQETGAPAADAAQPATVSVQPDLFGDVETTTTVPRIGRRGR